MPTVTRPAMDILSGVALGHPGLDAHGIDVDDPPHPRPRHDPGWIVRFFRSDQGKIAMTFYK